MENTDCTYKNIPECVSMLSHLHYAFTGSLDPEAQAILWAKNEDGTALQNSFAT